MTYLAKRREYLQKLRKFLNQSETDGINGLCNAANSNENVFWKLIKGQRSSSQELLKTILVPFPLMLKRISTKRVKKQECYFQRTLIVVKLTP